MQKRGAIIGGAIAAFLTLVVGLPLYAINLSDDFGKSVEFVPLVRHMISQIHCYDIGTDDCETKPHFGNSFSKEYTMGFLLDGSRRRMRDRGFEPLYLCSARDDSRVMMVTAGTTEDDPKRACRNEGFRARRAGYISPSDQIEAPSSLYRCTHPDTRDTILTNSASECTAQSYNPAEFLGYLYAGGPQASP